MYEMLVGIPPFYDDDKEQLYYNVQNEPVTLPDDISEEAKDLIIKLLEKNPKKRLGYNGAWEVKSHIFFKDINWNGVYEKKLKCP